MDPLRLVTLMCRMWHLENQDFRILEPDHASYDCEVSEVRYLG